MSGVEPLLSLAEQVSAILGPLRQGLASEAEFSLLLRRFGWDVKASAFRLADVKAKVGLDGALSSVDARFSVASDGTGRLAEIGAYRGLLDALRTTMGVLRDLPRSTAPAGIPAPAWSAFTAELLDTLVVNYLARIHGGIAAALLGGGVIEADDLVPSGTGQLPHTRFRLVWDRLPRLLSDPADLMRELYGWRETGGLRFDLAFARLGHLLTLLDLPAESQVPSAARLDEYFDAANPTRAQVRELKATLMAGQDQAGNSLEIALLLLPVPERTERTGLPRGLSITPFVQASATPPTELLWPYSIDVTGSGGRAAYAGARLDLMPSGTSARLTGAPQTSLDATARLLKQFDTPRVLVGSVFSHRLEIDGFTLQLVVRGPVTAPEVALRVATHAARLVIDSGGADGFLSSVLGEGPWKIEIAAGVEWSSLTGLHFEGAGTLETRIPLNVGIGPLTLRDLLVQVAVGTDRVAITGGVSGSLELGPVVVSVENLGLGFAVTPTATGQPGLLGDLDVDFGFRPPDGLALTVDTGVVTGGGFLGFDPAHEQYAGQMHLEFEGIGVQATGLLTTRLPGGRPGFSLLVLISTEFPPVQLGLGFMLVGVGGLLGINRTVAIEALRAGLKTNALGAVLSPPDPKASPGQVVAGLAGLFPPAAGRHVFAPTARIVWGTPTLITIELALVLEVPAPVRLAVLGRIRALLPDPDEPIVRLQVDMLGVIDFDRGTAAVDATLVDSRLAQFALTGDLAMRMSWGDDPSFLLAVGGFHPRFAAPAGFPAMQRVAVALASGDNPKLRLEAYLALTSNTVQFGSRVDLGARAGSFSIAGFLSFDALVTLSPLAFIVDISAKLAVKAGGHTILSVSLDLTLSGPQPWHARGRASFSILFFDVSFGFDVSIGDDTPAALPAAVDVAPLLLAAFADLRSWQAQLPAGTGSIVTLREIDAGTDILAHPLATLQVRQRIAPLERTLDRFGSSVPSGARRFRISQATISGVRSAVNGLQDRFAPAQFTAMSDDAKLSAPSFQDMLSGATIGTEGFAVGAPVTLTVLYEELLVGAPGVTAPRQQRVSTPGDVFALLTSAPPAPQAPLISVRSLA